MIDLVPTEATTEQIEVTLLLEALRLKYGYEYHNYGAGSILRRLNQCCADMGLKNLAELQHQILHQEHILHEVIARISVNVTEVFRDPEFYITLKKEAIPRLRNKDKLVVWVAGCATGEEAYSVAILLEEMGLLEKSQIYGTDINHRALDTARAGYVPLDRIPKYELNYQQMQGRESLSHYFTTESDQARLAPRLLQKILFTDHNLVTDHVFIEADLVLCRNVLIYFDQKLQKRVGQLLHSTLSNDGLVVLGSKEDMNLVDGGTLFAPLSLGGKIYQKRGEP